MAPRLFVIGAQLYPWRSGRHHLEPEGAPPNHDKGVPTCKLQEISTLRPGRQARARSSDLWPGSCRVPLSGTGYSSPTHRCCYCYCLTFFPPGPRVPPDRYDDLNRKTAELLVPMLTSCLLQRVSFEQGIPTCPPDHKDQATSVSVLIFGNDKTTPFVQATNWTALLPHKGRKDGVRLCVRAARY